MGLPTSNNRNHNIEAVLLYIPKSPSDLSVMQMLFTQFNFARAESEFAPFYDRTTDFRRGGRGNNYLKASSQSGLQRQRVSVESTAELSDMK